MSRRDAREREGLLDRTRMICTECGQIANDEAVGWRGVRYDLPDHDNEPLLASYCPDCAEREFGER